MRDPMCRSMTKPHSEYAHLGINHGDYGDRVLATVRITKKNVFFLCGFSNSFLSGSLVNIGTPNST